MKVVFVTILVVLLILVGFLGYRELSYPKPNLTLIETNRLATSTSSNIPGWDTFKNEILGYEISYPKSWYMTDAYTIPGRETPVSTSNLQVFIGSEDGKYRIEISRAGNFGWTFIPNPPLFIDKNSIILNYSSFGSLINFFQSESVKVFLERGNDERNYQEVDWNLQQKDIKVVKEIYGGDSMPRERFFLINQDKMLFEIIVNYIRPGTTDQSVLNKVLSTFKFIK